MWTTDQPRPRSTRSTSRSPVMAKIPELSVTPDEYTPLKVFNFDHIQFPQPRRTKKIWFNVEEPTDSFFARSDVLLKLHEKIQQTAETDGSPCHMTILCGLSGTGKTELTRKYLSTYRIFYENVVWINAECKNSMENSFSKLARKLRIHTTDVTSGLDREMEDIVRDCYAKICTRISLIVFDDAENFENNLDHFLPSPPSQSSSLLPLPSEWVTPFVLVTSKNQDWTSLIQNNEVVNLGPFDDNECASFLMDQLQLVANVQENSEVSKLGSLLGGLPLALRHAVACIRDENEAEIFSPSSSASTAFTLTSYSKMVEEKTEEFLNLTPKLKIETNILAVGITWRVALDKIQKKDDVGQLAIKMGQIMAFLCPDAIPVKFVRGLFENETDAQIQKSLNLLSNHALLTIFGVDGEAVRMHALVQQTILDWTKETGEVDTVLTALIGPCKRAMDKMSQFKRSSDVLANFLTIIQKFGSMLPAPSKELLNFEYDLAIRYRQSGKYEQASNLFQKVYAVQATILDPDDPLLLMTQQSMALLFFNQAKLDEALDMYQKVYETEAKILKSDSPDLTATLQMMVGVLVKQGKKAEAADILKNVYEERVQNLGDHHIQTQSVHDLLVHLDEQEDEVDLESLEI